jgi:hypothetical protein
VGTTGWACVTTTIATTTCSVYVRVCVCVCVSPEGGEEGQERRGCVYESAEWALDVMCHHSGSNGHGILS